MVSVDVLSTRSYMTAYGEKRVVVEINFIIEDVRNDTRSRNANPVEIKFDEDGDLINYNQYFTVLCNKLSATFFKMITWSIGDLLDDNEIIDDVVQGAFESALQFDADMIHLENELELFNRRNAIEYALKHGDKQMFDVLTGAAR